MTASLQVDTTELHLAWRRMLLDRPDRVFVSHPASIEWIKGALDDWLSHAQQHLAAGYLPRTSRLCLVPKAGDLLRPGSILDLEDELVYNLLVGRMLAHIAEFLQPLQGDPDVAYQLQPDPSLPRWVLSGYRIWRQWREKSLTKLTGDSAYVLFTDLSGFYDNIDLPRLFSDLRSLGATEPDLRLLSDCLKKWSYPRGKGIPQGYSASDILAKVYLGSMDFALKNEGLIHLRYVDDVRIFCKSRLAARKAIRRITELLHGRGLTLQAAKTMIRARQEARIEIDGVTPLIEALQQQLLEEVQEEFEEFGSYMNPTRLAILRGDSATLNVEVLERAFHDNFSIAGGVFNASLFRFLLHRLGSVRSRVAVDHVFDAIRVRPEETRVVLRYLSAIRPTPEEVEAVATCLASRDTISDYQRFELLRWFYEEKHNSANVLALARRWAMDANREPWLRSYALAYLGEYGDAADFERLERRFQGLEGDLEKAECLTAMRRQEKGRRNALYARVEEEGFFTKLAVLGIKSSEANPTTKKRVRRTVAQG